MTWCPHEKSRRHRDTFNQRQTDALGEVRQLPRWHVTSSRKPSGVALVQMSSNSTESQGPSPWLRLAVLSQGAASEGSLRDEGWVSNPPQICGMRLHISAAPPITRIDVARAAGQVGDPRPPRAVCPEAFPRRSRPEPCQTGFCSCRRGALLAMSARSVEGSVGRAGRVCATFISEVLILPPEAHTFSRSYASGTYTTDV